MHWTFEKLKKDLEQSKYNLKKCHLYTGEFKMKIDDLLKSLNEIEKELKENSNGK